MTRDSPHFTVDHDLVEHPLTADLNVPVAGDHCCGNLTTYLRDTPKSQRSSAFIQHIAKWQWFLTRDFEQDNLT